MGGLCRGHASRDRLDRPCSDPEGDGPCSQERAPRLGRAEFAPRGDAVLVAPATFNTINKVAVGLNDTLALGLINEAIGSQSVPVAFVPWVNPSLSGHPAYHPSLTWLRSAGAHIAELAAQDPEGFDAAIASTSDWLVATASGSADHAE